MPKLAAVRYKPTMDDHIHENKLRMALSAYHMNTDPSKRDELWKRYTDLHAKRSPEFVRHMEQRRGIYRESNNR